MAEFSVDKLGDRSSVMVAHLPATPAEVFAAMTECEHLGHWLNAAGRDLVACASDARTGGKYRYEFAMGGRRFVMFGEFLQVEPGVRTVHSEAYEGYDWAPLTTVTTFAPDSTGTRLRVEVEYPTAEIRDTDFPNLSHALEGYGRLGAYLAGQ